MRKAHPHGVQGRRPIAPKYKRALKEKKIEAIRKWAKEAPADESNFNYDPPIWAAGIFISSRFVKLS